MQEAAKKNNYNVYCGSVTIAASLAQIFRTDELVIIGTS